MKPIVMTLFIFSLLFTAVQADDLIDEAIWIDVRSMGEYRQGHKEGALHIPHTIIGEKIRQVTTNKNAEIHLYCAAGVRAGIAKRVLEQMGYTNVLNEGGLSDVQ